MFVASRWYVPALVPERSKQTGNGRVRLFGLPFAGHYPGRTLYADAVWAHVGIMCVREAYVPRIIY